MQDHLGLVTVISWKKLARKAEKDNRFSMLWNKWFEEQTKVTKNVFYKSIASESFATKLDIFIYK
jgi:hypothetical protein